MTPHVAADEYWSQLYDEGRDFTLIYSEALSRILSFTKQTLPKICLDIGCGTGQLTRELLHRGYQCVGIDVSASAVRLAQSFTVTPVTQVQYVHFDIEKDSVDLLPRQQYSLITCKLVYAFITDKPAFLQTVKHLLAPGGIFVVITPHLADVPVERSSIAVGDSELTLLASHFTQIARYKGNEQGGSLTYFVGQ